MSTYNKELTNEIIINELNETKEKLDRIIDFSRVGTWVWNIKTGEVVFNEKWAEIKGYTLDELKPLSIKTWHKLIHPDDLIQANLLLEKVFSKELKYYEIECRMKHKDGNWVWIIDRGSVSVWDKDGSPLVMEGLHTDITNLKQIEESLRESEALYHNIFKAESDSLFLIDQESGSILKANDAACEKYGYTFEEITKLKNIDMSAEIEKTIDKTTNFVKAVPLRYHKKKDGAIFPVNITASKFIFNNKSLILAAIRDISESKAIEEKLAISNDNFEYMFMHSNSANLFIEVETGKILNSNLAASKFYGYSNNELNNMSINEINTLPSKEIKKNRLLALSNECNIFNFKHKLKNEEVRDVEVHSTPFKYQGKTILFSTIYDISDKKKTQEEIERLSYRDQLTDIYNRRFYEEELERLDTSRNYPLSIAVGDINGLKLVNDSFGHAIGDELIKRAVSVIKKICRSDDIVARVGGDEFVIILPKTSYVETERLISRIEEHALSEKVGFLNLSITFGCETKTKESESIESIYKKAEDKMYKYKLFEGISTKSKTIDLIMNSLYEKNEKERRHAANVSELCEKIALAMKLERDVVNQMKIAGLMHDIGRIGIDESVLSKVDTLTIEDRKEIERHSEVGYRILSSTNQFSEIASFVLEHHERWDGQGYPKGIRGKDISMQGRIIAIADSFDAMTSDRIYCKALSLPEATDEIKKCAGTQFDPNIAKIFVEEVLLEKW
jgi:diguanylate cyclase (GGDEF)-like protein/PAS domain S-box-containing protein